MVLRLIIVELKRHTSPLRGSSRMLDRATQELGWEVANKWDIPNVDIIAIRLFIISGALLEVYIRMYSRPNRPHLEYQIRISREEIRYIPNPAVVSNRLAASILGLHIRHIFEMVTSPLSQQKREACGKRLFSNCHPALLINWSRYSGYSYPQQACIQCNSAQRGRGNDAVSCGRPDKIALFCYCSDQLPHCDNAARAKESSFRPFSFAYLKLEVRFFGWRVLGNSGFFCIRSLGLLYFSSGQMDYSPTQYQGTATTPRISNNQIRRILQLRLVLRVVVLICLRAHNTGIYPRCTSQHISSIAPPLPAGSINRVLRLCNI